MKRLLLLLPLLLVAAPADAFWSSKRDICAERSVELTKSAGTAIDDAFRPKLAKLNEKWWRKLGIKEVMPSDPYKAYLAINNFCSYYKK